MDELVEKLGWKKVAALLIGASVLGLIFVVISFVRLGDLENENAKKIAEKMTAKNNTGTEDEIESKKTYVSPYYQVQYPDSFTPENYSPPMGVLHVLMLKDNKTETQVTINVYDVAATSIEKLSVFDDLNYQKENLMINDMSGVKFEGKTGELQEKIAILKSDSYVYRIMVMNSTGVSPAQLNSVFTTVTGSLR